MSNRARTTRYASDDHADDLLADILDSTEHQAREEAERLEQSLAEKRRAEEQAAAEARASRLAERQQKLERELERQAKLAERRTQRMEALKVPEPVEEEAPQETTPVLDEDAIRRQIAEEVREELRVIGMTPMPEPQPAPAPPKSRRGFYAAAAGILLAGGIAAAGIIASASAYTPDPNPYAKAVFAPMDREAVALEMSSDLIPKAEAAPVVAEEPAAKPARKVSKPAAATPTPKEHRPGKSVFNNKVERNDASKSLDKFEGIFGNADDPFTIDE